LVAGILSTLAQLIKDTNRELMMPLTPSVWRHVNTLLTTSPTISSNVLARKLSMKVAQRTALTLLDPTRISATAAAVRASRTRGTAAPAASAAEEVLALTQDGMEIVPAVIDTLLAGLRDGDTVVRWSAAKGLGRIAVRLPALCAEDINDALLELFSPVEMDAGWQGACLALAEVVRHGLLPPSRLPEVPLPATAINIEICVSQFHVGVQHRDQPSTSCLPSTPSGMPPSLSAPTSTLAGSQAGL
jgi:tubulin-specific chaperone D